MKFNPFFEQNQDKVNPKEAADIISKHVHDYFGDEQDHYVSNAILFPYMGINFLLDLPG